VFLSSGSEAVEFGVQALRQITRRPRLLTLVDSFLSSYGSAGRKDPREWSLFDWSRCPDCPCRDTCDRHCPDLTAIPFEEIAGFVFEPGSSSGLVRFPPRACVRTLAEMTRAHGGFIQINEVTTGMGRTGRWFGYQHYGLEPDLISMGKGLGNGYPISAVALAAGIRPRLDQIDFHYSQSHQNDPLGCAVAREVLVVFEEQEIVERGRQLGNHFLGQLKELQSKQNAIFQVRGRGAMMAVELQPDLNGNRIDALHHQLLERGFVVGRRPSLPVFRLDPPLVFPRSEIDNFIKNFGEILGECR
jgi:acetylornithine aminotransferase